MSMIMTGLAIGVTGSLIAGEFSDVAPYLARRIVRWAAYSWSSEPELAAAYSEEWLAVIDERPGKLLKLATALGFAGGAIGRVAPRVLGAIRRRIRIVSRNIGATRRFRALRIALVTGLYAAVATLAAIIAVLYAEDSTWVIYLAFAAALSSIWLVARRRPRYLQSSPMVRGTLR